MKGGIDIQRISGKNPNCSYRVIPYVCLIAYYY